MVTVNFWAVPWRVAVITTVVLLPLFLVRVKFPEVDDPESIARALAPAGLTEPSPVVPRSMV